MQITRSQLPALQKMLGVPHSLHHRWRPNTHEGERANQLAANNIDGSQQKLFTLFIRFADDGMAMVERTEKLSKRNT
jgi:hypothetical protein